MAINDEKICAFLARKPSSRAVDLADHFDVELADMSAALRSLVDVGDIVRVSGTGPNGQQAQLYSLSQTFMRSKDGRQLLATTQAAQAVAVAAPQTPAPESAAEPLPHAEVCAPPAAAALAPAPKLPVLTETSTLSDAMVERLNKKGPPVPAEKRESITAHALSYIEKNQPVNDAQLRAELGLSSRQYPSDLLRYAVKVGRVVRVGDSWRIGEAGAAASVDRVAAPAPAPAIASAPVLVRPASAPLSPPADLASSADSAPPSAGATPAPAHVAAEAEDLDPALRAYPVTAPVYRYAQWSDGVVELQRDGETVCRLARADAQALAFHLQGAAAA
jgi:hypothetical protein